MLLPMPQSNNHMLQPSGHLLPCTAQSLPDPRCPGYVLVSPRCHCCSSTAVLSQYGGLDYAQFCTQSCVGCVELLLVIFVTHWHTDPAKHPAYDLSPIGKSLESQQKLKIPAEEFCGAAQKASVITLVLSHTVMCFFIYILLFCRLLE